jgi:hypothetical protein
MKMFLWKDKSGRGFRERITLDAIVSAAETEPPTLSWHDEELGEWAKEAEEGDKWEDDTNIYTCINS